MTFRPFSQPSSDSGNNDVWGYGEQAQDNAPGPWRPFSSQPQEPAAGAANNYTDEQINVGQAPRAAPAGFDFGSLLGGIGRGVENFTSGLQNNFRQSGVGQFLGGVEQATQAPQNWLANRLGLAQPGTPQSPEYQAAQLIYGGKKAGYTPTPEQVSTTGTFANAAMGSFAGGDTHGSLAGRSVPLTARPTITDLGPRNPGNEMAAPVRPALGSGAQLALPAGDAIPMRPGVIDTTARVAPRPVALTAEQVRAIPAETPAPFEVRYGAAQDAFRARQDPTAAVAAADARWSGLKNDIGTQTQAAVARRQGGLTQRGVATTPALGREGLTLTGRTAAAPREVMPVPSLSLEDLNRRTGAVNVPDSIEQRAAQAGQVTPEQSAFATKLASDVADRKAISTRLSDWLAPNEPAVTPGRIAESGMSGPLVGRALGRGGSQIARVPGGDLASSIERQAKVHAANEAAIAASRAGDTAGVARAKADVALLGGSASHTDARIARATNTPVSRTNTRTTNVVNSTTRTTTNDTVMSDMQRSIDALAAKRAAPPGSASADVTKAAGQPAASSLEGKNVQATPTVPNVGGGLRARLGRAVREDIGGGPLPGDKGRYGTPDEVARAFADTTKTPGAGYPGARASGAIPPTKGTGPRATTMGGGNSRIPPQPPRTTIGGVARATPGAIGHGIEEGLRLAKGLVTPFAPLHAGLRHAAPLLLAPSKDLRFQRSWLAGAKASAQTYGSFIKDPAAARIQMTQRLANMKATLDGAGYGRVEIKNPHGTGKFAEEWTPSNLPNKIPGLGRFFEGGSAGFTMFLNEARYAAAKYINNGSKGLTAVDKAGISDRINHFTGRGFRTDTAQAQAIGRMASLPFFSPELQTSYFRQMGDTINALRDPMKAENKATLQMATGQLAATGGMLFAAAALGLPIVLNPTDSNFGKVDLGTKDEGNALKSLLASQLGAGTTAESNGHVYFDVTHGMAGYIKALAETVANVAGGGHNAYGDVNVGDPLANLIINHLAPVAHEAGQLGRAFLDPRHRKDEIQTLGAITPITAQGPIEAGGGKIPGSFTFNDLVPKGSSGPRPVSPSKTVAPTRTTAPRKKP